MRETGTYIHTVLDCPGMHLGQKWILRQGGKAVLADHWRADGTSPLLSPVPSIMQLGDCVKSRTLFLH